MSLTPTDEEEKQTIIEVKPDQGEKSPCLCLRCKKADVPECGGLCPVRDSGTGDRKNPWYYWFRIELPPPNKRIDFFGIILCILMVEILIGPLIGFILRSIFG